MLQLSVEYNCGFAINSTKSYWRRMLVTWRTDPHQCGCTCALWGTLSQQQPVPTAPPGTRALLLLWAMPVSTQHTLVQATRAPEPPNPSSLPAAHGQALLTQTPNRNPKLCSGWFPRPWQSWEWSWTQQQRQREQWGQDRHTGHSHKGLCQRSCSESLAAGNSTACPVSPHWWGAVPLTFL